MDIPGSAEFAGAAPTFDDLVAEGDAVPLAGWDFSWFAGRATEERPSWGYSGLLAERMARASVALDVQTGGGEVLARIPHPPGVLVATDSWPPNIELARRNLAPLGASVIAVADDGPLPFADDSFDLVVSRHPVVTPWPEIARVLTPGGTFLSQQIGNNTNVELSEFMMGPLPRERRTAEERIATAATAAGLIVRDLRHESLRVEFNDVGAVVHFLRKVLWTVPGFTVNAYREQLARMHRHIERFGPFVAYSRRLLVEAGKPAVD